MDRAVPVKKTPPSFTFTLLVPADRGNKRNRSIAAVEKATLARPETHRAAMLNGRRRLESTGTTANVASVDEKYVGLRVTMDETTFRDKQTTVQTASEINNTATVRRRHIF
jgi:hypothetical protein